MLAIKIRPCCPAGPHPVVSPLTHSHTPCVSVIRAVDFPLTNAGWTGGHKVYRSDIIRQQIGRMSRKFDEPG